MLSRRSWIVLVAGVVTAAALPARATPPQKLFFIQRSKNADEVHYDARLNTDGTLAKDPVEGYWLNRGPDGAVTRAELTLFQKMAYGYDTEPSGNGTVALKLRAFKDRPMWIVKIGARWRVQTTIAGKQAYLSRLYVKTDESGMMPKVLYVDVFGEDAASGGALTEHLVKG